MAWIRDRALATALTALGGFAEYAADPVPHHQPRPTITDYLRSARFWFPCHGSRFKPTGDVISGPAEAPVPEAE